MYLEVNGRQTFFSHGNGKLAAGQPNVVFLHGAGMEHSLWVLPARYFARHHYNVCALDFPGHGRSEGDALQSIQALADWVATALDAFFDTQLAGQTEGASKKSAIVGHSMGALVALDFAARYPARTRALALLGTATPMPVTDSLLAAAKANDHAAIDMANAWSHSSFGQMGGNENPGMSMTMSGQRLLERAGADVFYTDLNACNNFVEGEERLAEVAVETLVLVGNQDRMTSPLSALAVAEKISNSRLVRLDSCGHAILSEQPNAALDALKTIV